MRMVENASSAAFNETSSLTALGISASRSDAKMSFDFLNLVRLATEDLCKAQSEMQRFFVYRAKTGLMLSILKRKIKDCENPKIVEEYTKLRAENETCKVAFINSQMSKAGTNEKMTYTLHIWGLIDDKEHAEIKVAPEQFEKATEIELENIYRSHNCDAEKMFNRAQDLMYELNVLKDDDQMVIDKETGYREFGGGVVNAK
jgi:hypothetical protein